MLKKGAEPVSEELPKHNHLEVCDDEGAVETAGEVSVELTQKFRRRLVTAALPYINNVPHLGHMVGSHLPADIFARYSRQKGIDTLLIGGSDEHGTPSEIAAEQLGIDHKTFCDVLHEVHKRIYEWFGISYDNYSRTSTSKHAEIVQRIFGEIMDGGYISKEMMEMYYDPQAERFLADRYVEGTCPSCGSKNASGDQCEVCTHLLDPKEILDPKSKLTGATPELRETEHLFLDLEVFTDKLKEWIDTKSNWRPQVKNLALGWLATGLKKRSITRDLKHGIHVPMEGMDDKVFYVWFEAPIAYISFLAEIEENWEEYWSKDAEGVEIYHFLGKDNIPFHTIFWPAILMAAGKYRMPDQVSGVQYLNYEGQKFSKSKNRGVFCESLLDSGMDPDLLRLYLTMVIPEKSDSEFSWQEFQQTINSYLVNDLSNFVHRSTSFNQNKFGGTVEKPKENELSERDHRLMAEVKEHVRGFEQQMDAVQIRTAIKTIFSIASLGNKYIDEMAPWAVIKEDPKRAQHILYICAYLAKVLSVLLVPFVPGTAQRIWSQVNFEGEVADPKNWTDVINFTKMPDVHTVNPPEKLFLRITEDEIAVIREKLSQVKDLQEFFK